VRHHDPLTPSGFPIPPSIHWWTTLRATFAGRRDAKKRVGADDKGHRSFTHVLAARAHQGQTRVDHWLHATVEPIDQRIALLAGTITDGARRRRRIEEVIATSHKELPGSSEMAGVVLQRRIDGLEQERDDIDQLTSRSNVELNGSLSARRHILDTARGGVRSWQAAYDQIASHYQRGFHRRDRSASPTPPKLPVFLYWFEGDLPLLVVVVDPEAKALIELALTRFHPGVVATGELGDPVAC